IGGMARARRIKLRRSLLEEMAGGRVHQRLGAIGADRAARDEQVEDSTNEKRSDEANGDITLRILRLLCRGRNGIESDIGEEYRGRGAENAGAGRTQRATPAARREGMEMLHMAADHR